MKQSTWPVSDAKSRFDELVKAAARGPQIVAKRGKPLVVVVAAEEYVRLRCLERVRAPSFADHLLAMPTYDGDFERLRGQFRKPV